MSSKAKLQTLRLAAVVPEWMERQRTPPRGEIGQGQRVDRTVGLEPPPRRERPFDQLLEDAELRLPTACFEDLEVSASRGLDTDMARQLASCGWVHDRLNVLVSGPTGVGKSYLACAIGHAACRFGLTALYRRVPRLLEELRWSKANGKYRCLLAQLAEYDVLILDDLGLGKLEEARGYDLLEVVEDRYGRSSTVVASPFPVAEWPERIGSPNPVDAILDRLVHNAYEVDLKGPSRRMMERSLGACGLGNT